MATIADVNRNGPRSAQPAASAVADGTLYRVSDEDGALERSDGESWQPTGGSSGAFSGTTPDAPVTLQPVDFLWTTLAEGEQA